MKAMSKRERLEATIAGQPVDRLAVALWRHWPVDDQTAISLARATLDLQSTFDFDFVKVSPSSNNCVADWGVQSRWVGNEEGTREWLGQAISSPEDWPTLRVLDPYQGMMGEMLHALELVGSGLEAGTPFIHTIFDPLTQATFLAGNRLLADLRQHPQELKAGLEAITESTVRFIEAARATGLSGIFLALQYATYDLLNEAEYQEFGMPYDRRILEATHGMWLNLLHLHGNNIMFDLAATLPVQAINWHDRETPPTLHEAQSRFPRAVVGGLHRIETMLRGTPERIDAEVADAVEQTGGKRLIIGTGCVTFTNSPWGNWLAARAAVNR